MAGVHRRKGRDGKPAAKYTAWWIDENGKQVSRVAYSDKAKSLQFARQQETQCGLIRDGLVSPAETERQAASTRPIAEHIADFLEYIRSRSRKGRDSARTYRHLLPVVMAAGDIKYVGAISAESIVAALDKLRQKGYSPGTLNRYRVQTKTFIFWLYEANRIREIPRGLRSIPNFSVDTDSRRKRRALTNDEVKRLIAAAETGRTYGGFEGWPSLTGPERAILYRLALGTGFRVNECRTLTPECFQLEGDSPTITVLAANTKNSKEAVQPIARELAQALKPFVLGKPEGKRWIYVPDAITDPLYTDLKVAGIEQANARGHIDFHSFRKTYISQLVRSGANPKVVQRLARHASITMTMDVYAEVEQEDLRRAIENKDL